MAHGSHENARSLARERPCASERTRRLWIYVNAIIASGDINAQRTLIGGALGYEGSVELIAFSSNPLNIEARFEGTLIANDSVKVSIRDGNFNDAE